MTRPGLQRALKPTQRVFRIARKLIWLAFEFLRAGICYFFQVSFRGDRAIETVRRLWLQQFCQRLLPVFNLRLQNAGSLPATGLLVCNHLSYLDILVIGALAPATFVAKREVASWPVFGWFATLAGTLFVDRAQRTSAVRSNAEIGEALGSGGLVVLFPEGTSSGGCTVLPFKSSLFAPLIGHDFPLSAAYIDYSLKDGSVINEVCYWREMTLLPHLLNLLGKLEVSAHLSVTQIAGGSLDRKQLARQLHSEVVRLKVTHALNQ